MYFYNFKQKSLWGIGYKGDKMIGRCSDDFFVALSDRPDLVKYVTFYPIKTNPDTGEPELTYDMVQEMFFSQMGRITSFYNFKLLGNTPKYKSKLPPTNGVSGISKTIYYKLKYVELLIFKLRSEAHKQSVAYMSSMIDFLVTHQPGDTGVTVYIDDSQLFNDVRQDPPKVDRLRTYYRIQLQKFNLLSASSINNESIKLELTCLIENLIKIIDPITSFYDVTPAQSHFERAIMSPLLPFADEIKALIDGFLIVDSQDFVRSILKIVSEIVNYLNLTKKYSDSVLCLLVYRFVFDEVYPINPYFESGANVIAALNAITIGELSLPLEYCPPLHESMLPREVFRNDRLFGPAVRELETAMLFTNPLDVIAAASKCIHQIEVAASVYDCSRTLVFPFEVTFGLFLGVVLSSSIPNLGALAKFADAYTPHSGLCPNFEYARAKIAAAAVQCEELVRER